MSDTTEKPAPAATKEIILSSPVVIGNLKLERLTLQEPTGEQVSAFLRADMDKKDSMECAAVFVAAVSGVNVQLIRKMKVSQLMEGLEYLTGFIPDGQTTGEKSPPT